VIEMSSGLNNIIKPIEVSKEDWVDYKGTYVNKDELTAGQKAWLTKWEQNKKQSYGDREKKGKVLSELKKLILKLEKYDDTVNIISLETSEYNLPKALPKYNFFIAQNNKKEYNKMLRCKPDNVKMLYYGNISDFCYIGKRIDYCFLDFCCTFGKAKHIIEDLLIQLNDCKLIALFFCLRNIKKDLDDYKFDLSNKLFNLLPRFRFFKVIPYRDKNHSPMITIFLHNIEGELIQFDYSRDGRNYENSNLYELDLCKWVKEQLYEKYPKLYKKIDESKNHRINELFEDNGNKSRYYGFEDMKMFFQKLFKDALKEYKFQIPRFEHYPTGAYSVAKRVYDADTFYEYFVKTISFQLPKLWDKKLDVIEGHNYWDVRLYPDYDKNVKQEYGIKNEKTIQS